MRPARPAMPLMPHPSHGLVSRRRTYPAAERKASLPGPARDGEDHRKTPPAGPDVGTDVELSDNREKWNLSEDNSGRVADWPGWVDSEAGVGGDDWRALGLARCVIALHDSEIVVIDWRWWDAQPTRHNDEWNFSNSLYNRHATWMIADILTDDSCDTIVIIHWHQATSLHASVTGCYLRNKSLHIIRRVKLRLTKSSFPTFCDHNVDNTYLIYLI